MPSKPPSLKPGAPRLRGRAAVEQRCRRLAAEPICRLCAARGKTVAATVPDHVVPLAKGGTDDDRNIRCLCAACHDTVTRQEFGYRKRVAVDIDGWPRG